MILQHNISATNAFGNYKTNKKNTVQRMEKLSSGYRINRAADDAAGLTISEGMRAMIRGLNRASMNAQDGMSLLQVADGALHESQSLIQRMRELSVQAANDTNTEADRLAVQQEINSLMSEIDRISEHTEFNTIKLLDGSLEPQPSSGNPFHVPVNNITHVDGLEQFLDGIQVNPVIGSGVSSSITSTQLANVNDLLADSIVPHAVNAFLNTFPSFQTAAASNQISQQIGLQLYGDSSTTLAYVSIKASANTATNVIRPDSIQLNLSVNVNALSFSGDTLTPQSRTALENTIVHEMMHAFMDDTLINGMMGATNGVLDASNKFPSWFTEGMAQSASGGCSNSNDWVNNGLGLTENSSEAQIAASVRSSANKLSSGSTASQYGTGYLACMYLAYLAAGQPSSINSAALAGGLNHILNDLMNGNSLNNIIQTVSGGTYASIADFENSFGDSSSSTFISNLLDAVGNTGNGSVVSSLTANDLLADTNTTSPVYGIDDTAEFVPSSVGTNRNWGTGGSTNTGNAYGTGGGGTGGSGTGGTGTGGSGTGGGGTGGSGGTGSGTGGSTPTGTGALYLQVGARRGQMVEISIRDMRTPAIGLSGISVLNHANASAAINLCDTALEKISETRSQIGAYMNRLEHTIYNLDNMSENTQAAESRIRDADMAEEMVAYSKHNILAQSGQAMLTHSIKLTEDILRLFG